MYHPHKANTQIQMKLRKLLNRLIRNEKGVSLSS